MENKEMDEKEVTRLLSDMDYLIKKYFNSREFCMAYETSSCDGSIIQSHTISECHIRNLERKGHVYSVDGSSYNKTGLYEFKLKGVSKVSRINGFCQYHDNDLFKSFEKSDFTGEYSQIYDLSFRALTREYFQKICVLDIFEKFNNGYFKKIEKTTYSSTPEFKNNIFSMKKVITDLKFLYEQLKKYKNQGIKYLLIGTSKLPIMSTGVLFTAIDAAGNHIQSIKKKQLGLIYNLISLADKSYILISTVMSLHNNVHKDLLISIKNLEEKERINYLLTIFFFNNDNLVISPDWLESLPDATKNELSTLMNFQVGSSNEPHGIGALLNFSDFINFTTNNVTFVV